MAARHAGQLTAEVGVQDVADVSVARPFLRWPGGKRWLAPSLAPIIRATLQERYVEPFLGSGAMFFAVQPARATLSDVNGALIATYRHIRNNRAAVIRALKRWPLDQATFNSLRSTPIGSTAADAARFLYLNRVAFSGIYRVNQAGFFNVPYGGDRSHHVFWETDLLADASAALRSADLAARDFETSLALATEGDVVYCDPTYTVAHANNGFMRFNEKLFSWADQIRLAESARAAAARGATVIVSNAAHKSVRALYAGASRVTLARQSRLSASPDHRGIVDEDIYVIGPKAAEITRSATKGLASPKHAGTQGIST